MKAKKFKMARSGYWSLYKTDFQCGSKGFTALSGLIRVKHWKQVKVRMENQIPSDIEDYFPQ